ncbi:MarR family winged helix-turn-helix transcriptional regulator [Microbacterium sp. NIBRBAC000506063]|uniref:MarR family winged helix-turn-helix transcriptional regulator n=1 Tax=Microbacterium sp. NIBRBAC000506063 TaxID=2734618 RepID=UPI001BB5A8D0|nr:MarR family transcriptional regulator [Microbacterium sp. NIBRBAC000506063]QTV79137.1 MarR family transcriptional regulator [Microbacterium sp. NIBRBAC000506063]
MPPSRIALIAEVLESVVVLGRRLMVENATPLGDVHLSRSQWDALFVLAHSSAPVTPGSLAAALAVTPGAVTQLVEGLRSRGLVETTRHPDDGRARILQLTSSARGQIERFERAATERMAPHFDALDEGQLAQLRALLAAAASDPGSDAT